MTEEAKCIGPHESPVPAEVGTLCRAHYQQQRRTGSLRPLRTRPGEGDQVRFRIPRTLKEAVEADAAATGIEPSEWWRRAGLAQLGRKGRRKRR